MSLYSPPKQPNQPKSTKRKQKQSLADIQLKLILYRFYAQIGFSLIVVCLCVFQLSSKDKFEVAERAIYWSSLSGTVANWLPSPLEKVEKTIEYSSKRNKDDDEEEDES